MKKMIKTEIYNDGEYYCGRCFDFDVSPKGKPVIVSERSYVQIPYVSDNPAIGKGDKDGNVFVLTEKGVENKWEFVLQIEDFVVPLSPCHARGAIYPVSGQTENR
jgi:hypothetical protein